MKILACLPYRVLGLVLLLPLTAAAEPLKLYAAGSLRTALAEIVASYEADYGIEVSTKFGPSGLLREAIEGGEDPDVFAAANMEHPEALAAGGWGGPVVLFARNQLCALAQPDVPLNTNDFLDRLLAEEVTIGTSTPGADPSGDYAWELFRRADGLEPGSFAVLAGKALQLTGGPGSQQPPAGRDPYAWVMAERKADVFLSYCTNAVLASKEMPALQIIEVPEELSVGADYGLVVRDGAPLDAWRLALHVLSPAGQKILRAHGFEAGAIPR